TGGLIAIVGEAGVGKSRLVAEVRRSPGAARWLEGHAVSIGRTISYLPFLEMIRTDAGITDRDGESESWSKIQQRVRALFGEDVDAILPYLARLVEVPLTPLGSDDSSRLVAALLGTDAAPPGLREVVLAKTEGNPFFIEELIRSLVELGVITHDRAEGWALARPLENVSIPDSVQGVIRARIDRLDDELKRVITVASVIGRSFFYRVLRSVTETDHELDRELGALQ